MIRALALLVGATVLAGAWLGPLPGLAATTFAAHMTMHVLVVAMAAPLLAAGLAGTRFDASSRWPALFAPLPSSIADLVVIWAWHAPVLHHLSRHDARAMALEQGAFLLCALWVWLCALGGDRATRDRRALGGAGALLMTSMHMTLLGALLTLGPRAIYAHGTPGAWSASALEDQQLGGMVMLLGAGSSYLLGALVLLGAMLQRRRRPA